MNSLEKLLKNAADAISELCRAFCSGIKRIMRACYIFVVKRVPYWKNMSHHKRKQAIRLIGADTPFWLLSIQVAALLIFLNPKITR